MWYPGYWGTAVGYYGGINYGYGYNGYGYYGGYWRGERFFYNRDVNRITNIRITNVYSQRVVERSRFGHVSYYGGPGGTDIRPTSNQLAAGRERRFGAINQQLEQERFARSNPAQRARENRGRPEIAATPRPGEFRGSGIVRATRAGAAYKEPPREVRGGREAGRSAPAPVERVPARNFPQQAAPNRQMERGAPAQPRNERPVYRNNNPGAVQRNQREAHPPQARQAEPRRTEARPQERNAHPQNEGKREGGNGRGPGRGHQ
jgi:hypothetical protein